MIFRTCAACDQKYRDYDDDREAICKECQVSQRVKGLRVEVELARKRLGPAGWKILLGYKALKVVLEATKAAVADDCPDIMSAVKKVQKSIKDWEKLKQ